MTRKELLSIVTFICHFCPFPLGHKFTLRTDHGSLTWVSNFRQSERQLARWIEKFQEYAFSIVHHPGPKHGNADALFRLPCNQCGRHNHSEIEVDVVAVTAVNDIPVFQHSSTDALCESQLQDTTISFIFCALELNQKPEPTSFQEQSPEV